jgi:hypothetical protein
MICCFLYIVSQTKAVNWRTDSTWPLHVYLNIFLIMIMSMGWDWSRNCGHQWAYCSPLVVIWACITMVEWYRQGKTPDSYTRAFWQSYLQSHLVASQEELGEGNYTFSLWSIFVHTLKLFLHAVKSYDMAPTAVFPLRRKAGCGFLSPLKIHRSGLTPRTMDTMVTYC